MLVSDIYASYLSATPKDGHLLHTPTTALTTRGLDSLSATPRAGLPRAHVDGDEDEDEDEPSPTQHCGTSGVGLRMLELCGSDDEGADEGEPPHVPQASASGDGDAIFTGQHYRDEARDSLGEGGWAGGQRMQQRMAERCHSTASSASGRSGAFGHQRGKLSFDDVVGILGA